VPPAELERLFERFYRRPGEQSHGSGLGLYIARMLANAHGGALTAESEVGAGSTFRLELRAWSEPGG
jgi:signal transduction histidine kinase